ncbi:MAG: molybdenum cofactor guanylyltransferase MobA [Pseudomonadota bacterium]
MSHHAKRSAGITGVILAGGRGTRMGGVEKGLLEWQGRSLIAHLIDDLAPQVDQLVINANRSWDQYRAFGLPVIADDPRYVGRGPMAGLHAALTFAATDCIVSVPCDLPGLPHDLVTQLEQAAYGQDVPLVMASTAEQLHPTVALMHASLLGRLQASLDAEELALGRWLRAQDARRADFGASSVLGRNFNCPSDFFDEGPQAH